MSSPPAGSAFKPAFAGFADMVRTSFAKQGMLGTIGARLVSIEPGVCRINLPYSEAVSQQQGFFHGGAIGAIGDVAAGYAAYSLMPEGSEVLTVEYKINLVKAARPPLLLAEAHVLRAGRTLTVCRAEVFRVEGSDRDLCAVLQATMMRVEPASR
jgi:uncharacterized protein (TIGR00369 family)